MQVPAGEPFTTSLVVQPGVTYPMGARVEVPVTRAIATAWVQADLDGTGSMWTVTLDPPVDQGDYQLVWRDGGPEPPQFEAFIPLTVGPPSAVPPGGGSMFPDLDIAAVRPTVDEVAVLANTRTTAGDGSESSVSEFTSDTRPTDAEVDELIDQAVNDVASQLPNTVPTRHYDRIKHAIALYTVMLIEGSFFREEAAMTTWQSLYDNAILGIQQAIERDYRASGLLTRMEPYPPLSPRAPIAPPFPYDYSQYGSYR